MIALLLASILTSGPEEGGVRPLGSLTTALRSRGGPEILIAPELRDEALYLRGVGDDPARLRNLIAHAVAAEWKEEGGGLRLARSAALRRRLHAENRAALEAGLREAIARVGPSEALTSDSYRRLWNASRSRTGDASPSPAQSEARMAAFRAVDPGSRAFARFCALVDPARLAEALAGPTSDALAIGAPHPETVRLLGKGGGLYRALPLDGTAFLATERAEHAVMITTPVERGPGDPYPPEETEVNETEPDEAALAARRRAAVAGGELGALVSRWPGDVSVALYAVDRDGVAALLGSGDLRPTVPAPGEPVWPETPPERVLAPAPPDARGLATLLAGARGAGEASEDSIEPLDILARPMLDALSEGETRPIVLDLPDDLVSLARVRVQPVDPTREGGAVRIVPRTVGDVAIEVRRSIAIEVRDGAVVGRAREPLEATARRFPRAELRTWWRAVHDPTLSVETSAALAVRIGLDPTATWFEGQILMATDAVFPRPEALSLTSDRMDLVLWRALPPAVRATLARGGTIDVRSLPPEAGRRVEAAMANDNAMTSFLARNGLPPLMLTGEVEQDAVAILADPVFGSEALDGEELGWRFRDEEPSQPERPSLRTARFRVGERRRQSLHVSYAPLPALSTDLWISEVTASPGEPVNWERLPPAILGPLRGAMGEGRGGDTDSSRREARSNAAFIVGNVARVASAPVGGSN